MALFVISCDPTRPGHDDRRLRARLRALGATRAFAAVWLLDIHATASTIRIDLTAHLHPDDRILVAKVDGDIAWRNLLPDGGVPAEDGFDLRRSPYRAQLSAIYALCDRSDGGGVPDRVGRDGVGDERPGTRRVAGRR